MAEQGDQQQSTAGVCEAGSPRGTDGNREALFNQPRGTDKNEAIDRSSHNRCWNCQSSTASCRTARSLEQ